MQFSTIRKINTNKQLENNHYDIHCFPSKKDWNLAVCIMDRLSKAQNRKSTPILPGRASIQSVKKHQMASKLSMY